MPAVDTDDAWNRLTAAAAPYRLEIEHPKGALLPDLVFIDPVGDMEHGRLRYLEPAAGPPTMRTIIPGGVSRAQQAELETHLAQGLMGLVAEIYSPGLWIRMLKHAGRGVRND